MTGNKTELMVKSAAGDTTVLTRDRALRKSGNSTVLTVPPEVLELTQFEEGDCVTLSTVVGSDEITLQRQNSEE